MTLVLLGLFGPVGPASADPWWGRDKALHLSVSLGLGSAAYGGLWVVGHDRPVTRFALAASLALLPGLAKELYDDGQPGNRFSGEDMMFNAVGALVGAGILLVVDLLRSRRVGLSSGTIVPGALTYLPDMTCTSCLAGHDR